MRRTLIFVVLIAVNAPTVVFAEELFGKITWPDGRAARGVTITIGANSVVTKTDGGFDFDFIAPGQYVLTIGVPGKRSHAERVTIEQGQKSEKNFVINW
jgi:Carboxypeptidase regulatory-like domain